MYTGGAVTAISVLLYIFTQISSRAVPSTICTGCSVSKGCFGGPELDCVSGCNCTYMVTYRQSIDDDGACNAAKLQLYVSLKTSPFQYIAMGFSNNQAMGNTSVTQCSQSSTGKLLAAQSYNVPNQHYNLLNPKPLKGILSWSIDVSEGDYLTCDVTRAGTVSISGNAFDVCNDEFYLLVAAGPLANQTTGQVARHTMSPLISATLVNISSTETVALY